MKKVSKKALGTAIELGRVYKVTTYLFMDSDSISVDNDFYVSGIEGEFTTLRQTVESKPVTDEF